MQLTATVHGSQNRRMWRLVRAAVIGLLIGTLVATLLPDLGEAASFAVRIACVLAALIAVDRIAQARGKRGP